MSAERESYIKKYPLPGGEVEVHKPFGDEFYIAFVEVSGRYPEEGQVANDRGRDEYFYVMEGEIDLTLNHEEHHMLQGESKLVANGSYYNVNGHGKVCVFVHDQLDNEGKSIGTSAIIDSSEQP